MIEELVNHEARFPLSLDVFRASSDEKARALLRGALKHLGLRSPSLARLTEMARQFKYARDDGRVSLKVSEDRSLGIHRGHIYCYQHISSYSVKWRGEKEILLPHGVLRCLDNQACRGVRVDLDSDTVEITCRKSPNETLKRANRPQRTLGDLLREAGVPHWARDAYPRVYQNDRLVCVPSRGVDECAHAHPKGQYVDFIFEPNEVSQGSVERALTTQTNKSRRR
jgi:tRNA(Ile)-lysidine synthase